MNRSNMAKVLAAFVAGVVLTMGSLIYSRSRQVGHFQKPTRTAQSPEVPASAEDSAFANPPQEFLLAIEDVKSSNQPLQSVEARSEKRVLSRVPEPAVPKMAHSNRLKNNGPEKPQIAALGAAPNIAPRSATPESAAPGSAAKDDTWHTLSQTNPVPARAQQPSSAEPTPTRRPRVVTLQAGTSVSIRLEQSVSTDRNRSGDMFRGSLDSPLIVNGFVLAEKGAVVLGQIEKLKRARLLGSGADLGLKLTAISMADGQRVAIQTSPWEEKGTHARIGDTPKMAAGAALGAVVGALTGAAKGAGFVSDDAGTPKNTLAAANKRNLVLTTGARLTFRVATPLTITERLGPR